MKTSVKNPELIPLFNELKSILVPYEKYFTPKKDQLGYYDLWSFKDVEIAGRKKSEIIFAGLIIQKSYVGFYYMPVYTQKELQDFFGPELLATLKGKSCFYIKKKDGKIFEQIKKALEMGLELYQKNNWV